MFPVITDMTIRLFVLVNFFMFFVFVGCLFLIVCSHKDNVINYTNPNLFWISLNIYFRYGYWTEA